MAEQGLDPSALEGLMQMFSNQPMSGGFDISRYIGPATAALRSRLAESKTRAREGAGIHNMGLSGPLQAELGGLESAEMGQETDLVAEMLGRKAMFDQQAIERKRIQDEQDQAKAEAQGTGTGQVIGEGAGALASLIPGVGVALAPALATLGGEAGKSIAGMGYGEAPDLSAGISELGGVLGQQDKMAQLKKLLQGNVPETSQLLDNYSKSYAAPQNYSQPPLSTDVYSLLQNYLKPSLQDIGANSGVDRSPYRKY